MQKLFGVLTLLFLSSLNLFSQELINVTFNVNTPGIDDTSKVYIVGNAAEFGNWQPNLAALEKIGKENWGRTFQFPKGFRLEYKFTKGSWTTEALGSDATIPRNSILIANNDTTVSSTISNWRDNFDFKIPGQVTGTVEYHRNFVIDGLKPRDIIVWLPPDYNSETNKRYPVLYMHDAQNIFDPRTSTLFIDWEADETADSLIRSGEIESIIIVGMNNTSDRFEEYSNSPLGKLYMKLIAEKIKPFIDSHYRTLPDRNNTVVAGSSMGGLISFMIAWEYPDLFSKAACFSPAFKIRNVDYVREVTNDNGSIKEIKLYIDNGGVGLEAQLQPGVDEMIDALKQKGYEDGKDFFVYIDKIAEHNEAAWAERFWRPLKIFFAK
ncbi:MAG: histidine kinase [Ignavibacteriales bacterium]|nr:histidine kinase [Ignavibacteriales bacterium]